MQDVPLPGAVWPARVVVKSVSVSAELATLQRAVDGALALVELDRQGGLEGEDGRANVGAILALVSCRLRDLGRVAHGTLDVDVIFAPHNAAVDGADAEDLVLHPHAPAGRARM